MKKVAVLGSTGCVGKKTLKVIKAFPEEFIVTALACKQNVELLKEQIKEFSPKMVYVADKKKWEENFSITLLEDMVQSEEVDVVVFAMDGIAALEAAFLAASAKKDIALANKEILVCAGSAFTSHCQKNGVKIFPIDSEHCALEEALLGEDKNAISKLVLTASGGPFFQGQGPYSVDRAIAHPTYSCGAKVAINCATMMNKGLELIEAKHLFGVDESVLDIVIHPQSVVQSMVSFVDGTTKAVLSYPDISRSIQYALLGKRKNSTRKNLDFTEFSQLTFYPKEAQKFRCLDLAIAALKEGGAYPAFLNAANEVLVERFYGGVVSFRGIGEILEELMNKEMVSKENSLEAALFEDKRGRVLASAYVER